MILCHACISDNPDHTFQVSRRCLLSAGINELVLRVPLMIDYPSCYFPCISPFMLNLLDTLKRSKFEV